MTQAGKVAEIFTTAGEAFSKLGTLAMSLQPGTEGRPQDGSKWGDEEIDMLRTAVKKFGTDVEKISTKIKTKSAAQMKAALKQKVMQSATGSSSPLRVSIITTTPSASTPVMTIPRHTLKVQTTPRQPTARLIGQKSKALPIQMTIRGATPMSTQMTSQMTSKKIRLDTSAMSILTSIAPSPIGTLIRQNTTGVPIAPAGHSSLSTIGVPIMASGQGFQVIVPPQKTTNSVGGTPTVLPVTLLQSGIVQRVSNANTNGNVDVES